MGASGSSGVGHSVQHLGMGWRLNFRNRAWGGHSQLLRKHKWEFRKIRGTLLRGSL